VETYDERFTTVSADRLLQESLRSGRRRREVVDTTAAAVILQGWLDRRRQSGPHDAEHDEARNDDD
jgi:putative Holliday junction resolvase